MITGLSSGISAQLPGSAQVPTTKEAGLIFDSLLSGRITGKEPTPDMQEETPDSSEMAAPEESTDQEAMEQAYMNLFLYRILQDGKSSLAGRTFPTEEKADQAGEWLVSVADQQLVITEKLNNSALAVETRTITSQIEDSSRMKSLPVSEATIVTESTGPQADERATTTESIGVRASEEKEFYSTSYALQRQQIERSLAGPEIRLEQKSENSLEPGYSLLADELLKDTATIPGEHKMRQSDHAFSIEAISKPDEFSTYFSESPATVDTEPEGKSTEQPTELLVRKTTIRQTIADEEEKVDQAEAAAKATDFNGNKSHLNQGPINRDLATENVFGHKPSKVTASHIEDIQKTIEMQIEKTPVLSNTVVKILLTPDNIGDIHVKLIKTKESITAVLHVKDAETKGLLEDQLPLLMEPFKHSISEVSVTITVVADTSLAFSFSEGADPGHRKMERQESRKRTSKEKTETKQKPMTKQPSSGLSLLA
ncbi:hypothetical protein PH235_07815 [Trichococcus sp. K1Tr]|uniref:hypothetical protein n=1 Tax=Trichococcus sp. K1Tr TaxID=3020847 RepID=UPI0023307454|nr:hypothetical protein [Trichococcus sp. K1Tr]MDB6353466.1 hypothetical protein [Trichococcus sp. K1Tr]